MFNAKPKAEKGVTLSEMKWDIVATNLNGYNSGNYAGVQIGTKNVAGSITLTSSADWNYQNATKITAVRLWLNTGGSSVTSSVTIGGKTAVSDGTKVVKNSKAGNDWTKATKVTFTPAEDGNTGVVVINVSSVKAGYICAMEIDCEDGAPAANLTSIAVSGTPTKTTYFDGEPFDPTGLVVTGTYDDGTQKEITDGIVWVKDPEILKLGTTSVDVMASVGNITSDIYIVNGITVNEKVVLVGNSIIVAEDKKNSKWVAMSTSNIIDTKSDYFESVDLVKVGDKYITTGKLDDILFYVNTVDGKTTIQNPADDKYVQATAAKKVSYTENVYLWSNDGKNLTAATADLGFLKYNASASRFNVYTGTNAIYFATIVDKSNVYEGAEIALSGTDGTHYFTTFSSDKAVEFVDATVYTVGVNDNKLSLNEVKGNQVPANTGVLVQSNETNAMYVYIESAPAIEGNLLRASVTEQTTTGADDTKEYKYYMLSYNKDNENLGFYWGENDGAAFTSKAGRAYLAVEKTNEVAAVKGFSLSDMETGISQVCGSAANKGVIYDLQGRRVERAVRGLYIMNGRKVMVK